MTRLYRGLTCGDCLHFDAEEPSGANTTQFQINSDHEYQKTGIWATQRLVPLIGACMVCPPKTDHHGNTIRPHRDPCSKACGSFEAKGEG